MNEKTITIYIHDLEISDKSKSFLARVGLMRLNDLLNSDMRELSATRNREKGENKWPDMKALPIPVKRISVLKTTFVADLLTWRLVSLQ